MAPTTELKIPGKNCCN